MIILFIIFQMIMPERQQDGIYLLTENAPCVYRSVNYQKVDYCIIESPIIQAGDFEKIDELKVLDKELSYFDLFLNQKIADKVEPALAILDTYILGVMIDGSLVGVIDRDPDSSLKQIRFYSHFTSIDLSLLHSQLTTKKVRN